MSVNVESVRKLAEQVGAFHLRDGGMRRAQRRILTLLEAGGDIPQAEADAYVRQVAGYFTSFEREACNRLRDLEKRLAHTSQLQFNLTAERGVAQRRVEITRDVLSALEGMKP